MRDAVCEMRYELVYLDRRLSFQTCDELNAISNFVGGDGQA